MHHFTQIFFVIKQIVVYCFSNFQIYLNIIIPDHHAVYSVDKKLSPVLQNLVHFDFGLLP